MQVVMNACMPLCCYMLNFLVLKHMLWPLSVFAMADIKYLSFVWKLGENTDGWQLTYIASPLSTFTFLK